MKKISLLAGALFVYCFSFAQANLQGLVKPGTKLIYGVETNGQQYDFIVTVKALAPAVIFDWEMTDRANNNGTITHTPEAMISGNTMYNYFAPGQKTLDDNTLSVWLSKNTFTALMKAGKGTPIKMNTGEAPKKMGTYTDNKEIKILVNGEKDVIEEEMAKELNDEGEPTGSESYFTFYKSGKMPIILRMQNGFYIVLKEIRTK
ncbi:MAG: hypothetical protein IPL84_05605 [Chitinophagaceae bacterium]|nr:hypothetical protein [Chitinophagaceae bacterium]